MNTRRLKLLMILLLVYILFLYITTTNIISIIPPLAYISWLLQPNTGVIWKPAIVGPLGPNNFYDTVLLQVPTPREKVTTSTKCTTIIPYFSFRTWCMYLMIIMPLNLASTLYAGIPTLFPLSYLISPILFLWKTPHEFSIGMWSWGKW